MVDGALAEEKLQKRELLGRELFPDLEFFLPGIIAGIPFAIGK